jgi:hypothetical protein
MLRIVDTPLLWATFFLRCVPSVTVTPLRYDRLRPLRLPKGIDGWFLLNLLTDAMADNVIECLVE